LRARIGALRKERARVQQAPPPIAAVKQKAREYIEALQAQSRPRITATHDQFTVTFEALVQGAYTLKPDLAAALAWLDPIALAKKLNAAIDSWPKPDLMLSASEKKDKLRLLDMELFETEREEEALIEQSENDGPVLTRRPDASPAAILGIHINKGKAASAAA
jgi:hypothetical protein